MATEVKEEPTESRCDENEMCENYFCGGCELSFSTICKLHTHVKTHGPFEVFYFLETTKTAYIRFRSSSISIQTDNVIPRSRKRARKSSSHDFILDETVNITDDIVRDEDTTAGYQANLTEKNFENEEMKSEIDEPQYTDVADQFTEKFNENSESDLGVVDDVFLKKLKLGQSNKQTKDTKNKSVSKSAENKITKTFKKVVKQAKGPQVTLKLTGYSEEDERSTKQVGTRWNKMSLKTDSQILMCKLCDMDFKQRSVLKTHIKGNHSGISFLCLSCAECCASEDDLKEHRRIIHNQGYYKCDLCNQVLTRKAMLESHILLHKGIKPYSCDICEPKKEFTRKSQLKDHMETHSTEKNLQCEYCGKNFNARYLMTNHVKHCGGIKPYVCDICEMKFISNHALQKHRRVHTGEKPFVCEVCAFASSNASCLSRHIRTHTGEKPFICKYCNQGFAAHCGLRKHVRVHTQEKPYKCKYCEKAFTQNWNLKTHERQHTGEKPYICHLCGTGYKQNVLLKSHLKTHSDTVIGKTVSQSAGPISTYNYFNTSLVTGSQDNETSNATSEEQLGAQAYSYVMTQPN